VRGIEVPDRTEDFTADAVELFFDLAYVLAFSQLVGSLIHDPTWAGVGRAGVLFGLLWLPWQQLTWATNVVSGNGRPVRLVMLAATAVSVPMAASTSTAFEEGGAVFAVSLAAIMCLGFAVQGLSSERGTANRQTIVRWVAPNAAAVAVLVAGAGVEGDGRVAVWVVSLAIVLGAMVTAGRGDWLVRVGHFAERHALIIIIALGEVIVAIGLPVIAGLESGEGVPGRTVAALVASGVFAGLIWWGYFDRPGPALEHRGEGLEDHERGRYVRDIYTWSHAPIVAGVILSAAALEEITLHPSDPVPAAFRVMLLAGLASATAGVAAAIWRAFRAVTKERLVAGVALTLLLAMGGDWDGIVLLVAVDAVLAATLLAEHHRIEH
jgi:low temperature requirement protein LtrA